jgi:hypothetical protein
MGAKISSLNDSTAAGDSEIFLGDAEMAERIGSFDWAETSLGSSETWSPALRMMVSDTPEERLPDASVVGTAVRVDLQRRLSCSAWYQASVGAGPTRQRMLERDLARTQATD